KVNSLKAELEAANARADAAEQELKKFNEDQSSKEIEHSNLLKKVSSLENDLDETEKNLKETTEKLRQSELKCENLERKVAQLESEVADKEKKNEELIEERNKLKAEYESVIDSISELQSSAFFTFSQQKTSNNRNSSVSPFEKSGRNRIGSTNTTDDTEGIDSFLLNYAKKQKNVSETANVEESNNTDLSSSSSNLLLSNFTNSTNSDITPKTSGSDVAKLLSDFLVPSEELYHIHIRASYNNTIVTLTNSRKDVLINSSGGLVGFKKAQRGGYEAAHQAAAALVEKVKQKGIKIKNVEVLIKGFGPGRDAAFKAIASPENPWTVKRITDSTPLPFGGCRPRKVRRL
ncbi:7317_t:CDS:2, partial [Scutellospora calospora]